MASRRMMLAPCLDVEKQDVGKSLQHVRIGEIQIDLIVAERVPDVANTGVGVHGGDERRAARAHHGRGVRLFGKGDEVVPAGILAADEVGEPQRLPRAVIDHQIEHQLVLASQLLHVLPATEVVIHHPVVDHRKAVVGRGGVERQQVDGAEVCTKIARKELMQNFQRRVVIVSYGVAVGYEQQAPILRRRLVRRQRGRPGRRLLHCDGSQPGRQAGSLILPVEEGE